MRIVGALFAIALLSLGCPIDLGGGNGDSGPREGYPTGPFGVSEGDILADLSFVSPDSSPFTLADVYRDGANKLLLATTAADWCVACAEEQPDLQQLHGTYGDRGLFVLVAIYQDGDYQPAEASDAERWKNRHELDVTVVADPDFHFDAYYDSSLTPMNMLVEVEEMKILRITTGWDPSAIEALVEAKL